MQEKHYPVPISKHEVCDKAMQKRLNGVNFRLRYFIKTMVATNFFYRISRLAKKISFDNKSVNISER